MEAVPHKDLKDRSKKFALAVVLLFRTLPKTVEAQVIGKQLLRAGTSVGANTRAAFRGRSKKEYIAKLGIVIEEADECGFWLELLAESGTMPLASTETLHKESNALVSIFTSLVTR
ncbi:MAG: four helix bundle protein [Flavobacteriales bacterium]|nr:four helix bundle protein [Flavobacteriales bacterium]